MVGTIYKIKTTKHVVFPSKRDSDNWNEILEFFHECFKTVLETNGSIFSRCKEIRS